MRKSEKQKTKEKREYEIFSEMPYKFSSKKYSQNEKHPLSKRRFDAACEFLDEINNGEDTDVSQGWGTDKL